MRTATETANIIRQQITPGVLMSLGAHKLGSYTDEHEHALVFMARVLPFTINGDRSQRPRNMRVIVTLNGPDTYDIAVDYRRARKIVRHFNATGIYADQLAGVLLTVDSDDDLQHASIGHENRVTG